MADFIVLLHGSMFEDLPGTVVQVPYEESAQLRRNLRTEITGFDDVILIFQYTGTQEFRCRYRYDARTIEPEHDEEGFGL